MFKRVLILTTNIITSLGLTGCVHQYTAIPDDPRFAPIPLDYVQKNNNENGSLYASSVKTLNLFNDNVAKNLGDIITVVLQEKTDASKNVGTNYKKENNIRAEALNFFGAAAKFSPLKALPFINPTKSDDLSATVNNGTEFKGGGDSTQSNKLDGEISVTITQILPNKNYYISGEKWVTLAGGNEYVRVRGIIRPEDISPNNTISSQKIADARIEYSGSGNVHQGSQPGWLSRIFNSSFFPI